MTLTDIVTAVVAVLAFILSVYAIYEQKTSRQPRMEVVVSQGHFHATPKDQGDLMIKIVIRNTGERSVVVTKVDLAAGDKPLISFAEAQLHHIFGLPPELQPMHSETLLMSPANLRYGLVKTEIDLNRTYTLVATVTDAVGRTYKGILRSAVIPFFL